MRRLSLLKNLTDILFFLALIPVVFGVPIIIMVSIMPERVPFGFKWSDEIADKTGAELITLIALKYIGFILYVYAVFLFRKTLALFQKKIIFDDNVIIYFDRIGKAIAFGYLIQLGGKFVLDMILSNIINISPDPEPFFIIGLGLFFMVLSDVFLMAKKHKEENDLTI